MIVTPRLRWLQLVLRWRGSILPRIWFRVLVSTTVAVGVVLFDELVHPRRLLTVVPFTLVGLAISIFLGFRNNTSYDRFWEGRKLWGSFVNTSRTMARQVGTLIHDRSGKAAGEVRALQRAMIYEIIAYIHCVRLHLRDQRDYAELAPLLPEALLRALPAQSNAPIAILQRLSEQILEATKRGWLDPLHVPLLEKCVSDFTDIQGGCERIKNTPIPFSYTVLIHQIVAIYCLGLPFGIEREVGFFTPLVVLFVSYAFFGLDAIGDEIEDPFGEDLNDLPISALSRMIEVNLRQGLGETELPPLHRAQEGQLR
jgi:ion channel-forming bestrophin family protein